MLCTTRGQGSGYRLTSSANRSQVICFFRERRPSHFLQAHFTSCQKRPSVRRFPSDAEVAVVTTHLGDERSVLLAYQEMAVPTTPFGDAMKRASEPAA